MGRDGTYDDEISLCAIDNISGIKIIVVSTLEQQGLVHFRPEDSEPLFRVTLGHFAEGQGFHYVVLEVKFNSTEKQSDPLGGKSQFITDKINPGENKIYLSENDINSGENEINLHQEAKAN